MVRALGFKKTKNMSSSSSSSSSIGTLLSTHVFTLENVADGVAGASGGISAITLFYPLNIIRTKLQTDGK